MNSSSLLTSEGELALNALLGLMKLQGVLNNEMINAQGGKILLTTPFLEWPKELQEKLAPYGAGPAIH